MQLTTKHALGVSIGAATGYTAYDLFARSHGGTWPNDLTGWLTVAVTALLVAVGAAVALRIVVAISNRKSANPSE
ncbi:hypothetical protein [Nocardia farcinica]|uniref:hypothetical protein n=1 Tax=Nocardia farcinica TaxID=37329 RepID=UPI0018930929|nr:hypothetical protein [Nocardia farcinica]MBF6251657.1 hypothetical protein [Nocardia farcinica]